MEWINIQDRLPAFEEEEYLVTDGKCIAIYWWKHFRSFGKKQEWYWSDLDTFEMNVTHWMPLPDFPISNISTEYPEGVF